MEGKSGRGSLFVISGPSGVGKGSVVDLLRNLRPETFFSISVTTREPRQGEENGREYSFVTKDQFEDLIAHSAFLEHAEVFGQLYGTPMAPIEDARSLGRNAVLEIDVQGAAQVRERVPDAVLVFLVPPSMDELRKRLRERGTEDEQELEERLLAAGMEMERAAEFDRVVENDDLERATSQVAAIIDKHRT